MSGQSSGAAERSAHVTRGHVDEPARVPPLDGNGDHPRKIRVVERLEAEVARLRAALEQIVAQDWWDIDEPDGVDGRCAEIARKALQPEARKQ